MAGHNKWSQIKHRKGAQDAKRGLIFSKISREIYVALRQGGNDPASNTRLRSALSWAKDENMPNAIVERAFTKANKSDSKDLEELLYEGFGPSNVAIAVECLSDNRNRTMGNLSKIFHKCDGKMCASNATKHYFEQRSVVYLDKKHISEQKLLDIALNNDIQDVETRDNDFAIYDSKDRLKILLDLFNSLNLEISKSELILAPVSYVLVDDIQAANKNISLLNMLEDDEDVKQVFSNLQISDRLIKDGLIIQS